MTRRRLFVNIASVMVLFSAMLTAACFSRSAYCFLKDFSNIVIATAAAYLAYCFQRRQAFLSFLRELWHTSIQAKAELIEYTQNPEPDQVAFNKAQRSISTTIDMVRGVYCNVGESNTKIGFYPFEPLHDMRRTLDSLGFGYLTTHKKEVARSEIMHAWNAFRFYFLKEFSVPAARHHITARRAKDPRR